MPVSTAKQLSLFLENKVGVLAKLCRALAGAKVSLKAISVSDSVDHAVVRLVVDKPAKARRLFEEHNLLVIENDVLAVSIPDRPGELGRVAARLSRAKLNINYLYGSSANGEEAGTLYMRVEGSARKVRAALKGI
ncbi:MAG: ACT domain-containing protein [Planctomycetota bacterium]|jgi:hypothetical protein